jgi:YihY family inner membrane protein
VDVRSFVDRLLAFPPVDFLLAVLDRYGKAPGGLLANGLAFAALFAALPTTLLVLGIAGWLVSDPAFQAELAERLGDIFPPLSDLFDDALAAVSEGAGVTSIIGLVGLLWGVTQFYATLDLAFSRIFRDAPERDFARRTLRGFVWVLLLVGSVLIVVVVAGLTSFVDAIQPAEEGALRPVRSLIASPLTMFLLGVAVVAVAYRVLPPRSPSWRSILPAAIFVGIAVTLLTQLFTLLVPFLVGAAAIAGSLAAAFIALAWLSFSFQALLYGAAWVSVLESRRAATIAEPEP